MHVTCSVGWLGAVGAFLVLAIAGLTSQKHHVVQGAYPAMGVITTYAIVPLSLGSFLTGLLQALGTKWGLFRHYWVVAKLAITVGATAILLLHTRPIDFMATVAAEQRLSASDFRGRRIQLVADASGALVALIAATALTIYKPRGLTRYGRRRQNDAQVTD
jgi:hypothetical protein